MFKDVTNKPIEGHFKLEMLDTNGDIVDVFESSNKIMRNSKLSMAEAMKGSLVGGGNPIFINNFVLGTEGHNENMLVPKEIDYSIPTLYSASLDKPTYPITFDTYGNIVDEGYDPNLPNSSFTDSTVRIYRETGLDNETIVYEITIPEENANNAGGPIGYTEAGLYTSYNQNIDPLNLNYGTLFAMRTFPAKIKDNVTQLRITWRIIF